MEITLFGAARGVTGSCYSITANNEKVLVDCGMFQGSKDLVKLNYENFEFNPREYKALILTHAHLDHCGRVPKLFKYGFKGKIYCTNATKELAFIVLMDAAKIAAQDTEHENKRRIQAGLPPRKPLYSESDVKSVMKLFNVISYGQEVEITKNIKAKYYDAGHIIGAASIQLIVTEGKKKTIIAFSADIGQADAVLVKNTNPIPNADYVFIESTYGDRLHPPVEERKRDFLRIVKETYARGGKLMIPSFAIERAQEILYYLGQFQRDKLIPKMKVFLDSPMAAKATVVFTKYKEYYNQEIQNSLKKWGSPFEFPGLTTTQTVNESKAINGITEPCIIIAGNGMCTGGRIKHHIRNNISDEKNTLLFIGYQAKGTLGYWIKQKERIVRLLGTDVLVNAKIESMEGFSAHADYLGLLAWLKNFAPKPKKVFIVHGEEEQSKAFAIKVEKEGMKTYLPIEGEKIIL